LLALTTTKTGEKTLWLPPSYRERMKAAKAEARAQRQTQEIERRQRIELSCELRRLALKRVTDELRRRGDKLSLYSRAQLVAMANAKISPWLVVQLKAQIAERNSKDLHKSQTIEPRALSVCETHERNGAAQ
jgi:hypothetical protein